MPDNAYVFLETSYIVIFLSTITKYHITNTAKIIIYWKMLAHAFSNSSLS